MDNLIDQIEQIMGIRVVVMDRIPEPILENIAALLTVVSKEKLLAAMESVLPTYIEERERIMSFPSGSGIAAEFQMAASLKVQYLRKTIEYLKSK